MSRMRKQPRPVTPEIKARYAPLAVCVFLAVVVAVVFGQTVDHEFVNFDDTSYVYDNPHITQGLTPKGIVWAMTTGHAANWHPLTWMSHELDVQCYGIHPGTEPWKGPEAGGHHATSVLLHAATAILLFLVLWRMTGDLWPSAFVATVFAIHPLHVESVAWAAERKDVLSGLFFVLTLAAYLYYVRRPFSLRRYLIVLAVFALGLMSKPMLVTVPFVLLLLDYWPLGRMSSPGTTNPGFSVPSRLILEKVPLLLLAVVSCVVTSCVQTEALAKIELLSLHSRIDNALVSYVAYLGQSVWPADLAVFYPHPGTALPALKVVGSLLLLAGISAGAMACWRRIPCLIVGWLWYLGMLVPVIGLVQVGMQAQADRYMYLPQIGLSIGLAWGVMRVAPAWPPRRWAFGVASSLVIVALMGCAWRQTTFWRNSQTLWLRALDCTSNNSLANCNLGVVLNDQNRFDEAAWYLQAALDIQPNNLDAHVNLGMALAKLEHLDAAMKQYEAALKIDPKCVQAHHNLAVAWARLDRLDRAVPEYEETLKYDPDNLDAHANLGGALQHLGRFDEAADHFQKALELATRRGNSQLAEKLKARLRQIAEAVAAPGP
jgi:protein O-mannosyl-transferase